MACMEHECLDCGHVEFNNKPGCGSCAKCGSQNVTSTFDEPAEDHAPETYPDPEED
jgi:predicted  nucleic acid-binding Zn-ribbon protein